MNGKIALIPHILLLQYNMKVRFMVSRGSRGRDGGSWQGVPVVAELVEHVAAEVGIWFH